MRWVACSLALVGIASQPLALVGLPAGWGEGEIDGKPYWYPVDDPAKIQWEEPQQDLGVETPAPVATTESEDGSPKVLFTLQVNLTDILGDEVGENGVVPLEVVDGANPLATAADFSAQHQLPEKSKNELAVAVMQYAKQNGFVAPTFSVPVQLPLPADAPEGSEGEAAKVNWFPGDVPSTVAAVFAQKHSLNDAQRRQLVRALAAEAKSRKLLSPVFTLDVEMPGDQEKQTIQAYDGDDIEDLASSFVEQHQLPAGARQLIRDGLSKKAKAAGLLTPVLELGVTLLNGEKKPLKLYNGDHIHASAMEFAAEHGLSHDERESLIAAVEEQGQARGMVKPLLFKFPIKVGNPEQPWITQVYVHEGDVPQQVAAAVASRYKGWDNPEQTIQEITDAILKRAEELNEMRKANSTSSEAQE